MGFSYIKLLDLSSMELNFKFMKTLYFFKFDAFAEMGL